MKEGEDAAAKRREANLMWRSRIEVGDTVSLPDYLEQVGLTLPHASLSLHAFIYSFKAGSIAITEFDGTLLNVY